jgi:hypothetical protein
MSPGLLSALATVVIGVAAVVVTIALIRRLRASSGKVRREACEVCGGYGPVMHTTYHQNTGMLVMRQHRQAEGSFCRRCHVRLYLRLTLHTFFLGWWGTLSLVLTPVFILMNTARFLVSQTLPGSAKVAHDLLEQKREYALNLLATKDLVTVVEVLVKDTGASQEQVLDWVEQLKKTA